MKKIFKNQIWHFLFLVVSFWIIAFLLNKSPLILEGELWGVSTKTWLYLAFGSPILHQVFVFVFWRLELHYKTLSKTFGRFGFLFFKLDFGLLILLRPITITFLAFANANTLTINPLMSYLISALLIFTGSYLIYSMKKYFSLNRAFGIDHFKPELTRTYPIVAKGIFKYSPNAMYVFGFLLLWVPGILLQSKAALLVALFSHIYIWVHYYCTEKPDMVIIYGDNDK